MQKVAIVGAGNAGAVAMAAALSRSCSETIPDLPRATCDGQPLPDDVAGVSLNQAQYILQQRIDEQIEELMAQVKPEMLEGTDRLQLSVGSESMAVMVRKFLAERGHDDVDVVVAAPVPSNTGNYWTPAMAEAKAAYAEAHDNLGHRVRHHAQFTKSQPTTKARKAARKRAKAGRKASR